ncbi:type IV pilus biogenesis protein EbsA [Candidatus Cyanaurora vandensis]|uniref:type IV pilus biogenesis protein EbsA n=1 Tax=Candidatus Cyanaurora vandensis TaxID=2714958 RepID=UPI00257ED5B2|nr:type IV pilus biogenesis protein EbsA [Candidatus Cyanaurora vandensis]
MQITPAPQREVALYYPYYPATRRNFLPLALGLYKQGATDGVRRIEGPQRREVPFTATWAVKQLPSDLTVCRVVFVVPNREPLAYEVAFPNTEFIGYLVETMPGYNEQKPIELPQQFYRRILGYA